MLRKQLLLVTAIPILFGFVSVRAEQQVVEISSSGVRYSVLFFNASGDVLQRDRAESGKFAWFPVPDGASKLEISSFPTTTGQIDIVGGERNLLILLESEKRLRLFRTTEVVSGYTTSTRVRAKPSEVGWVFLGRMDDNEVIKYTYLVDEDGLYLDSKEEITVQQLRQQTDSGKEFTVNFPLFLRDSKEGETSIDNVARPGQVLTVSKIETIADVIWARVKIIR